MIKIFWFNDNTRCSWRICHNNLEFPLLFGTSRVLKVDCRRVDEGRPVVLLSGHTFDFTIGRWIFLGVHSWLSVFNCPIHYLQPGWTKVAVTIPFGPSRPLSLGSSWISTPVSGSSLFVPSVTVEPQSRLEVGVVGRGVWTWSLESNPGVSDWWVWRVGSRHSFQVLLLPLSSSVRSLTKSLSRGPWLYVSNQGSRRSKRLLCRTGRPLSCSGPQSSDLRPKWWSFVDGSPFSCLTGKVDVLALLWTRVRCLPISTLPE